MTRKHTHKKSLKGTMNMKRIVHLTSKQLITGIQLNEEIDLNEKGTLQQHYTLKLEDIYNIRQTVPHDKIIECYVHIKGNSSENVLNEQELKFINDLTVDCVEEAVKRVFNERRPLLEAKIISNAGQILVEGYAARMAVQYIMQTDIYTCRHSINVAAIAHIINELLGTPIFPHDIIFAGVFHDIGKTQVPITVLNKKGPLTIKERDIIQNHPMFGYELIKDRKFANQNIRNGVLYHHEKFDGTGYPANLKGDEIPYIAQILAVADVYDAITTDRPYHKAVDWDVAIQKMDRMSVEFNPIIWSALKDTIERTHK